MTALIECLLSKWCILPCFVFCLYVILTTKALCCAAQVIASLSSSSSSSSVQNLSHFMDFNFCSYSDICMNVRLKEFQMIHLKPRGQRDGSLRLYSRISRPSNNSLKLIKLILFLMWNHLFMVAVSSWWLHRNSIHNQSREYTAASTDSDSE
jgi:hypothetical protein